MEGERLLGTVTWPARVLGDAGLAAFDAALSSRYVERAVDRAVDRLLAQGVVDRILAELTKSRELWLLVEEVAASPAVTEAVTHQTASFADQVAGGVRARSHGADAWLERQARRALRRPAR